MGGGPITENRLQQQGNDVLYEVATPMSPIENQYVTLEDERGEALVFVIRPTVKASDWTGWQKAEYALKDVMDKFALLQGRPPKSRMPIRSSNAPELRFRVVENRR